MAFLVSILDYFGASKAAPLPDQKILTPADRLRTIFSDLIRDNEKFKDLWFELNRNIHKPITISPFPLDKNDSTANLEIVTKCSEDCQKKIGGDMPTFPHCFKIRVNANPNRTNNQIAFSIIFETCNASFWENHLKLKSAVKDGFISDAETYATICERIEYHAVELAKEISDSNTHIILPFDKHLEYQKEGNHFQYCLEKYERLTDKSGIVES